jgi:hypothetical protein
MPRLDVAAAAGTAALAAGIAAELGAGWQAEPGAHDWSWFLRHVDGRELHVRYLRVPPGRAGISGVFPGQWRPGGGERCSMTVALGRPADQVVAEARRKVLPAYEAQLATCRADLEAAADADADREHVAELIASVVPGTVRLAHAATPRGIRMSLQGAPSRHAAEVTAARGGTRVDLDLRGLDPQVAVTVLEALTAAEAGGIVLGLPYAVRAAR